MVRKMMMVLSTIVAATSLNAAEPKYSPFGESGKANSNSTLNMHLCPEGKWAIGKDQWGKIVRVNMLKITRDDWADIPGVKMAWRMKGFEGEQGMANPDITPLCEEKAKPFVRRTASAAKNMA